MSQTVRSSANSVDLYRKVGRIGQGTYGTVYCAQNRETDEFVALKRIVVHNYQAEGFPTTSLREIGLLRSINHPHCVQLLDVVVGRKEGSATFLVFEYCEHDLSTVLRQTNPFSESEVKTLSMQLLSVVSYLHDQWIIHRDIKPSNILYNHRGQLKLADFGLARTYSYPAVSMTKKVVTLWYRAPELLLGCHTASSGGRVSYRYGASVDVWACGCVISELMNGIPLFAGNTELEQCELIFAKVGYPTVHKWPNLKYCTNVKALAHVDIFNTSIATQPSKLNSVPSGHDLFVRLFQFDPDQRVTAKAALEHEYFRVSPYPKHSDFLPTFPSLHSPHPDHDDDGGKTGKVPKSRMHESRSGGGKRQKPNNSHKHVY